MEWYFGNEVEDLVVPKDYYESSETDSWSNWGMNGFDGSNFPKKTLNFYNSVGMSDSSINQTSNSNTSQQVYNNSATRLWNDQPGFQQFTQAATEEEEDEEARINDIFFNSLLEEDPTRESTEPRDNTSLHSNASIFEDEMVNSQNGETRSSKYLKTHDFSPSTDWGYGEVSTNYQMPEQYTSNENSIEESVLNDLERVTAQFTDKTRICFRDAFNRLAESSKQPLSSCQDEEPMLTSNDNTFRDGETEVSESNTNVIDRAVANLMFHKFDYDYNENQQLRQVVSCSQHQTDYDDDAQVPVLELPQPTAY